MLKSILPSAPPKHEILFTIADIAIPLEGSASGTVKGI